VTAIELMPVGTFPGRRGWGYDTVLSFAPHEAYGGPHALARLVDAAHANGLAVILDVVYNHLGPRVRARHRARALRHRPAADDVGRWTRLRAAWGARVGDPRRWGSGAA
jgi:maltooligosyltrehalose trehalohydrolase